MTTAVTPHARGHEGLGPLDSRVVRANDLDWQPIKFPGVSAKVLMLDRKHGLLTALLKMEPGSVLPDHEHALIEQTYVLEGRLVDWEGPEKGLEVGPGDFVWRPAGSRHAACMPEGGLIIAIFQVPNKFFEKDGAIVDLVGDDWGTKWGHVVA